MVCECMFLLLQLSAMGLIQLLLLAGLFDAVNTVSLGAYGRVNMLFVLSLSSIHRVTCN